MLCGETCIGSRKTAPDDGFMFQDKTKLISSVSILVIALSVFYYFVIFLPQKEESKRQEALQKESDVNATKLLLESCLTMAKNSYSKNLIGNCLDKPKYNSDGSSNCAVNPDVLRGIQGIYEQEQKVCFDRYK